MNATKLLSLIRKLFRSARDSGMVARPATRVRVEMRVYRAAEDRWYDLPPLENVQ